MHIGHAITGVHVTPNKEGYIVSAERRAKETIDYTAKAAASHDLAEIKRNIALADQATNADDTFGVKESDGDGGQSHHICGNIGRCDVECAEGRAHLCVGFGAGDRAMRPDRAAGQGRAASTSEKEASLLVGEIAKLAQANLIGDDSNGDGVVGSAPSEYGLLQLRRELEDMIAREKPPYVTVDQWYLFNLVRLPNGKWVFDKFGRGGNIEGYK